jgi:soluble lytic murein transglycosylase
MKCLRMGIFILLLVGPFELSARAFPRSDPGYTIAAEQAVEAQVQGWLAALKPLTGEVKGLETAVSYWHQHRYGRARKHFARVLASDLSDLVRSQVAVMLGRMHLEAGAYGDAASIFKDCVKELPLLANWCRYLEAESRFKNQDYAEAAKLYGMLDEPFVMARRSHEKTCIASWRAKDFGTFDSCAAQYGGKYRPTGTLLGLQAIRAFEQGHHKRAAALVKDIRTRLPASGAARDVHSIARKLQHQGFADELELTMAQRVDRVNGYYKAYHYSVTIKEADEVLDDDKKGSEHWCRAMGLKGMAYARKREQTKSQPFFESYVKECGSYYEPDVLYRGVDAAYKAGNKDNAGAWADLLAGRFPSSTLCDDALLYVARMYDRKGDVDAVSKLIKQIMKQFPDGDMARHAVWIEVFALYKDGQYDAAIKAAATYEAALRPRDDYKSDGRLRYWMGRAEQKRKDEKAAREHFVEVLNSYPYCWYGLQSFLRLEEMGKGIGTSALAAAVTATRNTLPGPRRILGAAVGWELELDPALLLLRLGLREEAQQELEPLLDKGDRSVERRLFAAYLYDQAGRFNWSHQIMRREVPDYRYAYPSQQDSRWWKVAYPLPFELLIKEYGKVEDVPWTLIAGVMREESGFDPRIESYAHAIGLMQLLQKTASWIGGKQISTAQLRIPEENIPLGAMYLKYLIGKFNHPVLAVAGYNSGPGGVRKTLKRTRNRDIDEFVEHIPYDQTRRYTKRVIGSAWTYEVLYGEKTGVVPFKARFDRGLRTKKRK